MSRVNNMFHLEFSIIFQNNLDMFLHVQFKGTVSDFVQIW